MASVVEICNRALSNIGNSRSINSLTEASKEAGECSLHFEACRDAVLSDFDWNFATKRVALADTSNPPLTGNMRTSTRQIVCALLKLCFLVYAIQQQQCAFSTKLVQTPTEQES